MLRTTVYCVIAVSLLYSQVLVFAMRGPCTVTREATFQNTIRCDGGHCLGQARNTPVQQKCEDADENDCSPYDKPVRITYDPKSTNYSAIEIAAHIGVGVSCAGCVMGLVALGGVVFKIPPTWLRSAIELTCGGACAAAFLNMDGCWFVRCEQDFATKDEIPGGHGC